MDPRYMTPEMTEIWSSHRRNQLERSLWIGVLRAMRHEGAEIPEETIEAYTVAATDWEGDWEGASGIVEDARIAELEQEHGHDLYARLQFFNQIAGQDWAHRGLTSSDITENIQQVQIAGAAALLYEHGEVVAARWAALVRQYQDTPMVGRTHGRPAQVTTVGKRVADRLGALADALHALEQAATAYQPRGIKGAVGTRADLAALLGEGVDAESQGTPAQRVDLRVGMMLSNEQAPPLFASGQCYPRGNDLPILAAALQIAAACEAFATDVRLMSMLGLAQERPARQQVGSSAMPHKLNPRYSERICGLAAIARGYFAMLGQVQPWLEGDVSTSALRRVGLPGLFHAVDAALANTAYVATILEYDLRAIAAETEQTLPLLATGELLAAVLDRTSLTRSEAHTLLQKSTPDLGQLAQIGGYARFTRMHPDLGLTIDELSAALGHHRERAIAGATEPCRDMLRLVEDGDPLPEWPGELL